MITRKDTKVAFTIMLTVRADRPAIERETQGYPVTHDAHPGREFILARPSVFNSSAWRSQDATRDWKLYDRTTGFGINGTIIATLNDLPKIDAFLSETTPDTLAERLNARTFTRATKILQLDT